MLIKEPGLKQLCDWKCPIGEDDIFGCDINKKVEEFKKASKMGYLLIFYKFSVKCILTKILQFL